MIVLFLVIIIIIVIISVFVRKNKKSNCRIETRKNILGSVYYPFPNIKECPKKYPDCNKKIWKSAELYYKNCVNNI